MNLMVVGRGDTIQPITDGESVRIRFVYTFFSYIVNINVKIDLKNIQLKH